MNQIAISEKPQPFMITLRSIFSLFENDASKARKRNLLYKKYNMIAHCLTSDATRELAIDMMNRVFSEFNYSYRMSYSDTSVKLIREVYIHELEAYLDGKLRWFPFIKPNHYYREAATNKIYQFQSISINEGLENMHDALHVSYQEKENDDFTWIKSYRDMFDSNGSPKFVLLKNRWWLWQ